MQQGILVIDIGTTAVKASLYDRSLKPLGREGAEYQLLTAHGGIVEFEAEAYWRVVCETAGKLFKRHPELSVEGICVTTQGETMIPVDEDGKALHRAVVWLDGRAEGQGKRISELAGKDAFYRSTGVVECNGFCPVSKLLWFKEELPSVYENARYFLLLEDLILHRLAGRFVTEKSLLTTTGYFHLGKDRVWTELLEQLELDANKIPSALECGEIVGQTTPEAMESLGLAHPATVVAGAMDQVAAALGAGNFEKGVVTEITGTAMCIGATIAKAELTLGSNVPVYRHFAPDRYLALPVCMTAGIVLKWFKDELCHQEQEAAKAQGRAVYDVLGELAADADPLAGGVTLLPYFAGSMQPDPMPTAKGVLYGLTLDTRKQDMIRAIMEGVGFMLRENLELLRETLGLAVTEVRTMGGAAKSEVWNGIKADITGLSIAVMENHECTSAGAAALCAVALAWYPTASEATSQVNAVACRARPNPERVKTYEHGYRKFQRIYTALRPIFSGAEGAAGECERH